MKPFFKTFFPVLFVSLLAVPAPVRPQSPGDVAVPLESSESLRSLAGQYFGESDDWEIILYYNGLKSSDELKTGRRLWIPVQQYREAAKIIHDCQQTVIAANAEGAGILVPIMIEQAIDNLNRSVQLKKKGDLKSAAQTARQALAEAGKALAETKDKRLQSVTAVLAEMRGTVQYRPGDALQWKDTVLKQELIEKDRLRTLSRSYGNILFIDGSRVQMDENALIVIEAVDKDVLKDVSSVDILVVEGDVSTLINSLQANSQFKVKSPDVNTRIRSRNFLTSRDRDKTTRFSNYDGEMDVASSGKQVTLVKNEGTKVSYGRSPSAPQKLLEPPQPVSPEEEQSLFSGEITFQFKSAERAHAVQIQVSRNKNFTEIEQTIRIKPARPAVWQAARNGAYYWRICAIDDEQLQGPYSKPVGFTVQVDRVPPYLALVSPAKDTVVFTGRIHIRGRAEKGNVVTVNRDTAAVSPDGAFMHAVALADGKQVLDVEAVDFAGNRSAIRREITCNLGKDLFTLAGEETILSNTGRITVSGQVKPAVRLEANGHPVETHDNSFSTVLDLSEGVHEIALRAISPGGTAQTRLLRVTVDTRPPELQIDEIPAYTELPEITLQGSLSKPADVFVNEGPVRSESGRFSCKISLAEGPNPVEIRVRDLSGNTTGKSYTVVRDTESPRVLSYNLSANRVAGGESIGVSVKALDRGVGMARTCTIIVEIDPAGGPVSGLLKLNPESGTYTGCLNIPPSFRGALKLSKLYLSDYLGNTTEYP